jgi:hypothetical protein
MRYKFSRPIRGRNHNLVIQNMEIHNLVIQNMEIHNLVIQNMEIHNLVIQNMENICPCSR